MVTFESTAKSLQNRWDEDTPYVQDQDGNVYLRNHLEMNGEISSEDLDEDDYDYEYVIEEETEYEHSLYRSHRPKVDHYSPTLNISKGTDPADRKHEYGPNHHSVNRGHGRRNHPLVRQTVDLDALTADERSDEYEYVPEDLFDIGFGLLTGAFNTLPVGTNLDICGKNLREQ